MTSTANSILLEKVLIVSGFLPITVFGLLGNFWILISIINVVIRTYSPINYVFRGMSMYIFALTLTDILVLLMMPLVISYFALDNWIFGYFACKFFFAVESINKIMSISILTLMSFERYLLICKPRYNSCCRFRPRRFQNVLTIVLVFLIITGFLCSPIIYYAETTDVTITHKNGTKQHVATLCFSMLPDYVMSIFIPYIFFFAFVLPAIFISTFYYALIRRLRKNDGRNVTKYTKSAVRQILIAVIFHFVCWTPFWICVLIPFLQYFHIVEFSFLFSENAQLFRMISSFLPYVNSAFNWVFYSRALTHANLALNVRPRSHFFPSERRSIFVLRVFQANTDV
ncbi:putative G-protein coupled receptor C06G4.5 [Aphelenchoides besseyi]|nr:putative G-protein coupled receptor C06G4.5 [Aphelenchoides besseyi]